MVFGSTTESITWITPLDWNTSEMVILDIPPFSSVSITSFPFLEAVSLPPATVLKTALPLPFLMAAATDIASNFPART